MSLSRLQSYVDAILAIAATLLILNVTVIGGGPLSHRLVHAWPSYAAYAVSFLTIGVIWINHHAILRLIDQPDPLFVIQNLLLLLFVAFLPFPTHVLADALQSGRGARAAAVFYGIAATLMAGSFTALWIYASRGGRLLRSDAPQRVVEGITRSFRPGIVLYAAATLVGLVSAWASASLYAAITLFYVISGSTFSREYAPSTEREPR